MAEYKCQRCGETNFHGVAGGMCSPCCAELQALKEGDAVEWFHHKGSWRPATFIEFNHRGGTAKLLTQVGCEIHRKQTQIRVPGGRIKLSW
jgi:hypothetical protein